MAGNSIQTLASMANLQVASEAFWKRLSEGRSIEETLGEGNRNNSKLPDSIIGQFLGVSPRYKLIAHQELTLNAGLTVAGVQDKSGFSASVFLDTTTGQYTLSIRSTEFATSIRDPGDVDADVDIAAYGWAFAQVQSLESFWASLLSGNSVNGVNATTIPSSSDLAQFRAAVTGGTQVNVTGYSLGANVATAFTELHRNQVLHTYLFNGAGTGTALGGWSFADVWMRYQQVYANPAAYPELAGLSAAASAAWTQFTGTPSATYNNLYDDPRYVLAVTAVDQWTNGALASGSLLGSTSTAPRVADSRITDVYSHNYTGSDVIDSATARSGLRHGASRPIWYEDQPAWSSSDWVEGHSIVLLQDSLNQMAAFERLDMSVTEDALAKLFATGSSVNFDSLEKTLDGLSRVFGVTTTPVAAATADSQFADIALRNAFYERLQSVTDSSVFGYLAGQVHIEPTHDAGAARNDFAALLSLTTGAPFSLRLTDPSPASLASLALYGVHRTAYEGWLLDRNALAGGADAVSLAYTDSYLNDRATWLNALAAKHVRDEAYAVTSYRDGLNPVSAYTDIASGVTVNSGDVSFGLARIVFGSEGSDSGISGSARADRLYGGGGGDTLSGLGGNDWLEGNRGDDTLDGGEGNDILLGGAGTDTYQFRAEFGRDLIVDADGAGGILYNDAALPQGLKIFDGLWQSDDRQVTYTLVKNEATDPDDPAAARHDLVISFADGTKRIVIRGWNEDSRNLGITFGGNFALPATLQNYIGDFTKKTVERNGVMFYEMVGDNYVANVEAGPSLGAQDLITGLFGPEAFYGLGGNDAILARGGDDFIDGGDGSDILQGGLGRDRIIGGDGRDVIYGSSQGDLSPPDRVDFIPPTASFPNIWARGFNWLLEGDVDQEGMDRGILSFPPYRDDGIGDGSNFIDAGAGADWVNAGQADDIVLLGDGVDQADGMAGADVIVGGKDKDRIYGDGPIGPAGPLVIDAPGAQHGADILVGDAGDDILIGQGNDDIMFGGADDDLMYGDDSETADTPVEFHGADLMFGGTGDDTLVGGAKGDDLQGEAGDDYLWGDSGGVLPTSASFFDYAQHGDDTLSGGAGDDTLIGEGGADKLYGGAGDDVLLGDDESSRLPQEHHGADYLDGGTGDDALYGDGGNDTLLGGSGNDALFGEGGNDLLIGGAGADDLEGGEGNDVYVISRGDSPLGAADLIVDTEGSNTLRVDVALGEISLAVGADPRTMVIGIGGADAVTIRGAGIASTWRVQGAEGTSVRLDQLVGQTLSAPLRGVDSLGRRFTWAGSASDTLLVGNEGSVSGGRGDDVLAIGTLDTLLYAPGDGRDTLILSSATSGHSVNRIAFGPGITSADLNPTYEGVDLVLRVGSGDADSIRIRSFAARTGTASQIGTFVFDDGTELTQDALLSTGTLHAGTAGNDAIEGNGTVDRFEASGGDDTLSGLGGADTFYWGLGAGNDVVAPGAWSDSAQQTLAITAGLTPSDVLLGRIGDDLVVRTLDGGQRIRIQNHFDFRDGARSAIGIERITFSDGTIWQLADIESRLAANALTAGADMYSGGDTNDTIDGLAGADDISGGGGNDVLRGGAGNDCLFGDSPSLWATSGNDTLVGGTGDDRLDGSGGIDTYVFARGDGHDTIFEEQPGGSDIIELRGWSRAEVAFDRGLDGSLVVRSLVSDDAIRVQRMYPDSSLGLANAIGQIRFYADGVATTPTATMTAADLGALPVQLTPGTPGADTLTGGDLNEVLVGNEGDDLLDGEYGNDILQGGSGNDVYQLGFFSGQDVIQDSGANTIRLKNDLLLTDLAATRVGNDLLVGIRGTQNQALVAGYFADSSAAWSVMDSTGQSMAMTALQADTTARSANWKQEWIDQYVGEVRNAANNSAYQYNDFSRSVARNQWSYDFYANNRSGYYVALHSASTLNLYDDGTVQRIDFSDSTGTWNWGTGIPAHLTQLVSVTTAQTTSHAATIDVDWDSWHLRSSETASSAWLRMTYSQEGQTTASNATTSSTAGPLYGPYGTVVGLGSVTNVNGGLTEWWQTQAGPLLPGDVPVAAPSVQRTPTFALSSWNDKQLTYTIHTVTAGNSANHITSGSIVYANGGDDLVDWGDVVFGGDGNDTLAGHLVAGEAGNDSMQGGTGDDILDGGTGADTMAGNAGNDTCVVDSTTDVVTEALNAGIDLVRSSVTYTLGSNVENLALTGTANLSGTGNSLANTIVGNDGDNSLSGGSGNDSLIGGAGNDALSGGSGNDTMAGGTGNDAYTVDSASDVVIEFVGEGTDTVVASVTYALGLDVENLTLTGTSVINATGNAVNNVLTGNSAANVLTGGAGDDTYVVGTGDSVVEVASGGIDTVQASVTCILSTEVENLTLTGSTLINATGNGLDNILTGNSAANTLTGGAGNDTYVVGTGDTVVEVAGGGTDTVQSGVTWALTLTTEIENLTLTGSTAINGTGNASYNVLIGNSAANTLTGAAGNDTLDGGAGIDTLVGGAGNDIYVVDNTADVTTELAAEGTDLVQSSATTYTLAANVENLTLTGSGAINGTGNTLANVLTGNSANNTLSGLSGDDTYIGGAGNDALTDNSTTSNDIYRWGIGQGNDTITAAGGSADRIEIAAGVISSQVTLTRSGNNLLVGITGAADVLTVANWYVGTANKIEQIRLADGTVIGASAAPLSLTSLLTPIGRMTRLADPSAATWTRENASLQSSTQSLVQAMAQFNAEAAADTPWIARRHWEQEPLLLTPS